MSAALLFVLICMNIGSSKIYIIKNKEKSYLIKTKSDLWFWNRKKNVMIPTTNPVYGSTNQDQGPKRIFENGQDYHSYYVNIPFIR